MSHIRTIENRLAENTVERISIFSDFTCISVRYSRPESNVSIETNRFYGNHTEKRINFHLAGGHIISIGHTIEKSDKLAVVYRHDGTESLSRMEVAKLIKSLRA